MVESNYPAVVAALTAIYKKMDEQTARYDGKPLFVNAKTYPSVLNKTFGNQTLDQTVTAISLNDVFIGYDQGKFLYQDMPPNVEPGVMTRESVDKLTLNLGGRFTSIPSNGLAMLHDFFFGLYGRRSDVIFTRILHPESIVAYILTGEPIKGIWERSKDDMITESLTNFPVASRFNVEAFRRYMAAFPENADVSLIKINGENYRINLNNIRVDAFSGGIFDRNSRTFGTWSTFPSDGDYLYGINVAGTIIGILDNTLTGSERDKFRTGQWEKRIRYLCISAAMSNYTFSYLLDHVIKTA